MLLRKSIIPRLLFAAILATVSAGSAAGAGFKLGVAGGAVVTPDTTTVIVSVPSAATLVYYDAEAEKELKKVELEFKPLALAVQGKTLFASAKGAAVVHVLDLATGKESREIKIPGEPILNLACHPSTGLLYATNSSDEVYAIDPEAGKATKTKARGQRIAIDQKEGKFVYTGIQKPIRDQLLVEEGPNKELRVSLVSVGARAMMLKFAVDGVNLKLVGVQDNAALNGKGMAVSPDGKLIAMAGGGGWVSKTERRFNYGIAVFETGDLQTMAGQVEVGPYPYTIAFHPVLSQGVAVKSGSELIIFSAKSLAKKSSLKAPEGDPAVVLYAAQGTKLVHITCVNSGGATESQVSFFPLELSEQDKTALKAAYKK
jgi:hypothetical protein